MSVQGRALLVVLAFVLTFSAFSVAQSACSTPPLPTPKGFNMFTEQQDVILGEVFADSLAIDDRVIEDAALTSYLQAVGDRIAKHLPPNELKFRFFIVDAPDANAFAFPGGRVYFTRKIIANFKSEDELAGVMSHEMGHQIARHGALDWSAHFRDISKVTKVKTRADIEEAYHKFLDASMKQPGRWRNDGREDKEQLQADEVAVYAMAQAGYRTAAVVEFWDRFTESKGKKGSWFSDAFGSTLPETKRLREFVNNVAKLPPSCIDKSRSTANEEFLKWQASVRTYSGFGKKMAVDNLVSKFSLQPPLRSDVQFLRFSSDGKYLIAQDDASIFVLSRDPLKPLFRIDAEDAYNAQFTPDNKGIVFYTTGLRVEHWSIADQAMQDINDVHIFRSCRQTELSPDGKILACLEPDRNNFFPMELSLIDVAKGEPVFSKKEFIGPADGGMNAFDTYIRMLLWKGDIINMHFSPDSRYFVAGSHYANIAVDLTTNKQVSLAGSIKKAVTMNFAFLGPDRIFGVQGDAGDKSVVLKFPEGNVITENLNVGNRGVTAPGHGDYLMVRPMLKSPVGIYDIKQNKIIIGSRTDALDIYDGTYVAERVNGELGLYTDPAKPPIATVTLPPAPLARLHANGMSPDETLLAVSDRKRGAVWNVKTGERMLHLRGFRGVDFDANALTLDFPPADDYDSPGSAKQKLKDIQKEKRELPGHTIGHFDLASGSATEGDKFQQKQKVVASGKYLIVLESGKDEEDDFSKNATIHVKNIRTGKELWQRKFPKEMPAINYDPRSNSCLFTWELTSGGAKNEMSGDKNAKDKASLILIPEGSYLVEIVNLEDGKVNARFPVDTGNASFGLVDALVMDDHIYFTDNKNRVLVYTDKGELLGRYFGRLRSVSRDNKLMLLETERGRLATYDVKSTAKLNVMTFESPIGFADFSTDAKRAFVMTRDQNLYTVNVPEITAQAK